MRSQQATQQQRPQPHEDRKVQKLIERIETKLTLQAKAEREATQGQSKN
jgi:ribosomal protein L29